MKSSFRCSGCEIIGLVNQSYRLKFYELELNVLKLFFELICKIPNDIRLIFFIFSLYSHFIEKGLSVTHTYKFAEEKLQNISDVHILP